MGFFVKAAHRCADLHQFMASRFVSPRFSRTLFSHAGSFMSHQGGYVRARRRLCGRGGSGEPWSLPSCLWKVSRARLKPDVSFLLRGWGQGTDGEGTERRRAERRGVRCNRRSRWGMLLIHVFQRSSRFSLPLMSIPLLSFLLISASCSHSPLNSALHPFTHYPPSLVVYSFALFYLSIYHTYPWCTWAVAVSCGPVAIIILEALLDYSFQWQRLDPQSKKHNTINAEIIFILRENISIVWKITAFKTQMNI